MHTRPEVHQDCVHTIPIYHQGQVFSSSRPSVRVKKPPALQVHSASAHLHTASATPFHVESCGGPAALLGLVPNAS